MAKTSKKTKRISFEITTEPGSDVCVAGTFNNWDPAQYKLSVDPDSGVFRTRLALPPGRHEYKFVVNGVWCVDPNCPEWVPNDHGSLNSVISV